MTESIQLNEETQRFINEMEENMEHLKRFAPNILQGNPDPEIVAKFNEDVDRARRALDELEAEYDMSTA